MSSNRMRRLHSRTHPLIAAMRYAGTPSAGQWRFGHQEQVQCSAQKLITKPGQPEGCSSACNRRYGAPLNRKDGSSGAFRIGDSGPACRREALGRASVRRRGSRAAAVRQTALDGWLWTWAMTAGGIRIRMFGAVGGSLVSGLKGLRWRVPGRGSSCRRPLIGPSGGLWWQRNPREGRSGLPAAPGGSRLQLPRHLPGRPGPAIHAPPG